MLLFVFHACLILRLFGMLCLGVFGRLELLVFGVFACLGVLLCVFQVCWCALIWCVWPSGLLACGVSLFGIT